jgi:PiT family inorganic phosphate transporter
LSVAFLAFANGAKDNFKSVATLWGAGLSSYRQGITWATGFTVLGSITAMWPGCGLAVKFGLPISTTHALTGAIIGVGLTAAGFSKLRLASSGRGVVLPLLSSPVAAHLLTVGIRFLTVRFIPDNGIPDCICADEPQTVTPVRNSQMSVIAAPLSSLRWATERECQTG